ncbi:MAG: Sjogren's syndrome/scleroderma autoantigen 1 family protein [Halapricum sp.]
MSDFDKDAERERLRKQFEQEESQRETTERMSELLLKGATMTNAHCGTCGDPIFRYEGQEFCPTCQEVVTDEGDTAEGQSSADQADAAPADATPADTTAESPSENGTTPESISEESAAGLEESDESVADAGRPRAEPDPDAVEVEPDPDAVEVEPDPDAVEIEPDEEAAESVDGEPSDLPERRERAAVPDRDRRPSESIRRPDPPARREVTEEDAHASLSGDADLTDARESLRRSLVRFAREAERADDPRRATEHLEAAHEAAETLAAISEIR